jgi:hypothetical protein
MKEYPKSSVMQIPAFRILQKFIAQHPSQSAGEEGSFEEFEREIHRLFQDCEPEGRDRKLRSRTSGPPAPLLSLFPKSNGLCLLAILANLRGSKAVSLAKESILILRRSPWP